MHINDLIKIANFVVTRTRDVIPYSSNLPDPKIKLVHREIYFALLRRKAKTPQEKQFFNEIYQWHLDASSDKERYPLNDSSFWVASKNKNMSWKEIADEIHKSPYMSSNGLEFLERMASRALKYGLGNCGETSAYAMLLLLEYPKEGIRDLPIIDEKILIERVCFPKKPDDHAFLLLNRNNKIPLTDVFAWNDDTIICDPWTKEAYTKKQLFENKTEEEKKYLIEKFKQICMADSDRTQYFIGEQHNREIHSSYWRTHHEPKKFWRPKRFIDVVERPHFREQLPEAFRINISTKDINKPIGQEGETKLYLAAQRGMIETVLKLLKYGADPDITNHHGVSPILTAVENGQIEMVDLLILTGADPGKASNNGTTPLYVAAQNGQTMIVYILVGSHQVDINKAPDNGMTPLMIAVSNHHATIVEMLILRKADVNKISSDGNTALMFAIQADDVKSVQLLLRAGADPLIRRQDNYSALDIAKQKGTKEIIDLIETHLSPKNCDGNFNKSDASIDCKVNLKR